MAAPAVLDEGVVEILAGQFREQYIRRYGLGAVTTGTPIDVAVLRGIGIGRVAKAALFDAELRSVSHLGDMLPYEERRVYMSDGTWQSISTFRWSDLVPSGQIAGPALIDGSDTTVWLPDGTTAVVDGHKSLLMEKIQ